MPNTLQMVFEVDGDDFTAAGSASSEVKKTLKKMGVHPDVVKRTAICMYEGEINMVIHADGGTAMAEIFPDRIEITLKDRGPGIPDLDLAMQEGFSTANDDARNLGFGAGMGLPNMKKYSHKMELDTIVGQGTTVFMTILNDVK